MSKKSIKFLDSSSDRTKKNYISSIKKYEAFHGKTIDELVCEALDEQTNQVPPHMLKVIDRIEDFQNYLVDQDMVHGSINTTVGRIKTTYKKNRVVLPYITPLNPKQTRRREYIEYKDILTKDELRCALSYMSPSMKARAMTMIQGGLSNAECELLTTRSFIDELKEYHHKEDDVEALEWLSKETNPVIWVTKLVRAKTKKPYYALIGSEAVNNIASAKLYEMRLPKYQGKIPEKLLATNLEAFGTMCRNINKRCNLGLVAEESKLRPHNLRRFHATYIGGSALSYEENSLITNAEIDEMQGRGKTSVQDTYIKSNPLRQKCLYAKVMNNVSLYHEYEYQIIDDDVKVYLIDAHKENEKLKKEVQNLEHQLQQKKKASDKVQKLRNELGEDMFKELIGEILNTS